MYIIVFFKDGSQSKIKLNWLRAFRIEDKYLYIIFHKARMKASTQVLISEIKNFEFGEEIVISWNLEEMRLTVITGLISALTQITINNREH